MPKDAAPLLCDGSRDHKRRHAGDDRVAARHRVLGRGGGGDGESAGEGRKGTGRLVIGVPRSLGKRHAVQSNRDGNEDGREGVGNDGVAARLTR